MTRTEWFSRAWKLDKEINRLIEKRSKLYSAALRTTPTYSDMPRGKGTSDKVQNAIEQICLLDEEINRKIDELYNVKQEIMFAIAAVENPIDRRCMYLRFVEFKSWQEISDKLRISRRSVSYNVSRGIKNTKCGIAS